MFLPLFSRPGKSARGPFRRFRLSGIGRLAASGMLILFSGALQPLRSEITVVSYHLRDRAVVLDSLVMRKRMIFSFKSSRPLSELAGGTVVGALSHEGRTMAGDTAYIFDEAAGNLGFALPYEIPEGTYRLEISIIAKNATLLESYSGDFDREELKPYFKRGINFWDFTEPYAHLQCSGHGELTYRFQSEKTVKPRRLEIWARMMSDNRFLARGGCRNPDRPGCPAGRKPPELFNPQGYQSAGNRHPDLCAQEQLGPCGGGGGSHKPQAGTGGQRIPRNCFSDTGLG